MNKVKIWPSVAPSFLMFLNRRERLRLGCALGVRLFLVALDVIGLALVGASVALASGTVTDTTSITGRIQAWILMLGLSNPYAVFAGLAIAFFLSKSIFSIALNKRLALFAADLEAEKATNIFRKIISRRLDDREGLTNQEINHGVLDSASMAFGASVTALANVASELALLVVTAIFLAATNLGLFLVMALYFFIIFLVLHLVLSRRTTRFSRRIDEHWIASNETVQDTLVNSRQVYVSPNIAQFVDRFSTQRHHLARARAGINLTFAMPRYITEVALMLGIGALVLLRSIGGGASISASTIAIFIAGAFRVIASILPLQSSLGSLRQISEASKTALQILALPDTTICQHQVADLAEEAPQPPLIEISGLGYRYPGAHQLVFRNLSLRIEPRKFIAISGKSGVGKSTLADLILGLRKPTEGHIFYDGKDLDEYINDKPLSSFAYVSQNSSLFHGTLLENITFAPGELRVDNSALEGAIKGADLQRFVDGLPNGLETQLQPVTAGLSGGQVQRISLARAIYQRAQVVVLDEVTSALDGESEAIIADTISGLKGKVTLIVIAHREATIKDADLKIEL